MTFIKTGKIINLFLFTPLEISTLYFYRGKSKIMKISNGVNKKSLGTRGENIAVRYYENLGYKIIQQNFWTVLGEIDLVLEKDKKILLVEVKTRCNDKFGWGEECIGPKKIINIQQAYFILQQKLDLPEYYDIEVCAIELSYRKAKIRRFLV